MAAIMAAVSQAALTLKSKEMAQAGLLAGADGVLNPGLDPVGGVDVGGLAQPARGGGGPVGGPQAVPPAVCGLEQGQLRARVRPLTAGEDPHRGRPAAELISAGPFAQQLGQLGDVRFLDPAGPVRTLVVAAGVIGAALAPLFTAPSFRTFTALACGFLAQSGKRTVCGMLTGAGLSRLWPHDRAHYFFSRARWNPDDLGIAAARLVVALLVPGGGPVEVLIDDTLFRRRGKRVWSASWFH
jgi:DDE superfamily endonuclease